MTIRFTPDSLREAVMRPVAMASPDGAVYVEFIAPDFRFVFLLLFLVLWLVARSWRKPSPRGFWPLLLLSALAFIPWLATTGNGRYFLPFLLVAGPLCIALLHLSPLTRSMRLLVAAAIVAWQGFLIWDVTPFRSWTYVQWGDTAFEVEVPADLRTTPATYVGIANISYSLLAPRFHPESRWINISSQPGQGRRTPDNLRTEAFLRQPGPPLRLLFPSLAMDSADQRMDAALHAAVDDLLSRHELSIADVAQCTLLPSPSLSGVARQGADGTTPEKGKVFGFWLCPLSRQTKAAPESTTPLPPGTEAVFQKMERHCPRLFPPGDTNTLRIPAGAVRGYPSSDFKLYVLADGTVMYKYYRALNPVVVGTHESVLADSFRMDCQRIQGRGGLPWERDI